MSSETRIFTFFKGRVALHAVLEAAGIGAGDKVILPGYTCVVVPNAILYRGAEPVYVDVDPDTYNLDIGALRECLENQESPGAIKAIIAQHTYGLPADMEAIAALAGEHGAIVIEDACHALGSTAAGRHIGSFGHAAFFSSQWSKPVTTGLGGWARVNDPELAAKLEEVVRRYPRPSLWESFYIHLQYLVYRVLYTPRLFWTIQGAYRKLGGLGLAIGSSSKSELDCLQPSDYHKRMGVFQVRTLKGLLASVPRMAGLRRSRTELIERALLRSGLPVMPVPEGVDAVWLRYPLRVRNKEELLREAKAGRIELGDWFLSPVHPNLELWEKAGYEPGSCPAAEAAAREVVNIPTHPGLSEQEIDRIVGFLADRGEFPSDGPGGTAGQ